jgi:hypothetical protein
MAHLATMPKLGSLILRGVDMDDSGLATLAKAPLIREFFLEDCEKVTDAGLAEVVRFPSLLMLHLTGLPQITDAGMAHLSALDKLRKLMVTDLPGITDAGMAILGNMEDMVEVHDLPGVGDDTLRLVATRKRCWLVSLKDCGKITPAGLEELTRMEYLMWLFLEGEIANDENLKHLSALRTPVIIEGKDYPHRYLVLDITNGSITDDGLRILADGFATLGSLALKDNRGITKAGIAEFKEKRPRVYFRCIVDGIENDL